MIVKYQYDRERRPNNIVLPCNNMEASRYPVGKGRITLLVYFSCNNFIYFIVHIFLMFNFYFIQYQILLKLLLIINSFCLFFLFVFQHIKWIDEISLNWYFSECINLIVFFFVVFFLLELLDYPVYFAFLVFWI